MPDAMVAVVRADGELVVTQSWTVTDARAAILAASFTDMLGAPSETLAPMSALEGGVDLLAERGAVFIDPGDAA